MTTVKTSTLSKTTGSGPVELTGQNAAKAWAGVQPSGAAFEGSFNISSLSDNGTGQRGLSLAVTFIDDDYSVSSSTDYAHNGSTTNARLLAIRSKTSSSINFDTAYVDGDGDFIFNDARSMLTAHGDLA